MINDNDEFFGKIQPQLQAGQYTGWDIIVITNGRESSNRAGRTAWVTELPTDDAAELRRERGHLR